MQWKITSESVRSTNLCRDYIEKVDHGRIHFGIIKFVAVVLDRYKLGFEEVAGKV